MRNFAHLLSANVAGRLVSIFTLPIILRWFAPAEYAKLGLFNTVVLMTGMLVNWPGSAMGRLGREEFVATGASRKTFWSVACVRLPLVIVLVAVILLFNGKIAHFTQLPPIVGGLVAASLILSFGVGVNELLQAQERFGVSSWLMQLPSFFNLLLIAAVRPGWLTPTGIVLVGFASAASVLVSLFGLLALGRRIGTPVFDWTWTRNVLLFSWPFFFHYIGVYSLDYIDTIVLRRYMPLAAVGIYTVAYSLNVQLRAPILSLSPLIFPKLTSLHLVGEQDKVRWFYDRIVPQISLFVSIGLGLVMLLLPVIGWFIGERFAGAVAPLCVMTAGMAVHTITVFMTPMFYAAKRTGIHVVAYLAMAVVNLAVDLALVPHWGVMGAATGKFCADVTGLLIHGYWFRRIFGSRVIRAVSWGWSCWLVMAVVLVGANWPVSFAVWLTVSSATLWVARAARRFDGESADFYAKLGLPAPVSARLLGVYRRWLVLA